jgi:uncharacterized protein (DUF885 family)
MTFCAKVKRLNADEKFEKLSREMLERFLEKNPEMATFLGFHDPYDKLLSDGSLEAVYEDLELLKEWRDRMREEINFGSLSEDNKIDWRIIEHVYNLSEFSIYEQRTHETNPDALGDIGGVIFIMLVRNYAPMEKRVEGITSRLEKLPEYLKQFRTRFEKSKPVKLWTKIAIEKCQRMPPFFQFLLGATKGRMSDELCQKLQKAVKNLDKPLTDQLEWLKRLLPKTEEEWALGKEKFEKLLKLRGLKMTAEEIHELGEKYLTEMKEERARLAEKISPGKAVKEVMKEIQKDAPKTFEEALKATRKEMEKSRKFVLDNNLATVDEGDKLYVEETPSFLAPLIPFAALIAPGKFEKTQEGIYIVTRPKDIENLGKDLNYASIPNTAVHEGFPGHFLQCSRSNREGSFIRLMAQGTEIVEGWAHYCEEMMMEHGYHDTLESRLMQVNDVIWRAVRMIVDVKLSQGEMGFDEAVDMLIRETGMSKEGAVAEVRRYTQSSGYALSYLLGKHLILKLRREVKAKMGEKYSEKFFHDTITENGELPMFMLREVFDQEIAKL